MKFVLAFLATFLIVSQSHSQIAHVGVGYRHNSQLDCFMGDAAEHYYFSISTSMSPHGGTYYENISYGEARGWGDSEIETRVDLTILYVGYSEMFADLNAELFGAIGLGSRSENVTFYDDSRILSSSGYYSVDKPNSGSLIVDVELGLIKWIDEIGIKASYSVRGFWSIGVSHRF